ncbi:MAG: ABC transporter ATP-binding protein [Candidatus Aminicenantes bacterium]|nr:ABC transporter ATP-binding protein [Candidatus Aminicenantes bacterium]
MEYALEVHALRKEYPGFTLRDVSFALPRGHIMGLIGPNGAGKTTVIKLILNIVRRTAGEIQVLGLDNLAREEEVKSRVGFVLDETPFYGYLKVNGIASVIAPFYGTWDNARFEGLCREFELPWTKRVNALSRGMKMKLALAVALAHGAELILLDEPTSGLDPVFRRELLERLSALIQDGRTSVLFSTHITSDLERVADYITCLRQGDLVFSATRDEILDRWAIVKGATEILDGETVKLFRNVSRGPYGFTALTADKEEAQRRLAGRGAVVERIHLDDLVFFLGREGRPEKEAARE